MFHIYFIAIIASKGSVAAVLKVFCLFKTVMHYHQKPCVRNVIGLHCIYYLLLLAHLSL